MFVCKINKTCTRSYASGLCGAFTAVNMLAVTKLFPVLLDNLGFPATFWFYSAVMVLEVLARPAICTFIYIFNFHDLYVKVLYAAVSIPENRGESLVKTEDKLAGLVNKAADY